MARKTKSEDYYIKLTASDKNILASYCTLCDCLSLYLGSGYEIAVHSLGIGERNILKIVNSKFSKRSEDFEMDNPPVIAIEQLYAKVNHGDLPITSYYGTREGRKMYKTASIGIVGGGRRLIGMICFNFYMDTPFSEIVEHFAMPKHLFAGNPSFSMHDDQGQETILYEMINDAKQAVMNDAAIPSKFKKKEIIRRLNDAGVFQMKSGVPLCAEVLGLTITTVYMHIRNLT